MLGHDLQSGRSAPRVRRRDGETMSHTPMPDDQFSRLFLHWEIDPIVFPLGMQLFADQRNAPLDDPDQYFARSGGLRYGICIWQMQEGMEFPLWRVMDLR